jgi:hypothetical protein
VSKLPSIKRLATEDFGSQKDWIGKLLSPLNQFMDSVVTALNNQLTFSDNMASVVKTISVSGTYPLYFTWTRKDKPIGLWVVNAYEASGVHVTFTTAISADWEYTVSNQIRINSFVGLPTTTTYNVTIIVITG